MKYVVPIKKIDTVRTVSALLYKHYGALYRDVFDVGCRVGLRVSDLLALRYDDMSEDDEGVRTVRVIEDKTGKVRTTRLAPAACAIIDRRRLENPECEYIFSTHSKRNKGLERPLSRFSIAKAFKAIGECEGVNLALSSHSMRKTFGYHLYMNSGKNLALVQKALNHSNTSETLRYLDIEELAISEAIMSLEF